MCPHPEVFKINPGSREHRQTTSKGASNLEEQRKDTSDKPEIMKPSQK
jgi:hypothetical protein